MGNLGQGMSTEDGASAVEYGLLVVAVAAIIAMVVFAIGGFVGGWFSTTCNRGNTANVAAGGAAVSCNG
jgi:pilus assembly protein Flp/PilA